MPHPECRAAIEGFASADPARLVPLPNGCTLADARAVLHSLDAESRGQIGEQPTMAFAIHYFSSDKLPQLSVWVDRDDRVILIDADRPPVSAEAYLRVFGEPEARLDYAWRGATLERGEHVWPARGVVVVASPDVTGVVRVGVFAPTTLADYRAKLRYIDIETDDG